MRLINLFFLHFRLLLHRNVRNFILLLTEIILCAAVISGVISGILIEFNYKINYLDTEQCSSYAILAIDSTITDDLYMQGIENEDMYLQESTGTFDLDMYLQELRRPYQDFLSEIRSMQSVQDADYSSRYLTDIDGLQVTYVNYPGLLSSVQQKTKYGNWLSAEDEGCIVGGNLTELYEIGDLCYIDGKTYPVIDYLSSPYYYLDSGTTGTLDIYSILRATDTDNIVLTMQSSNQEGAFSSLIIKYDSSVTTPEMLQDDLAEFGNVYSFPEMKDQTRYTRNTAISENLPLYFSLVFICVLISASGLLISAETNKKNYAVLLLLGENKIKMVLLIIASHCTLLLVGWSIGVLLSCRFCFDLLGIKYIVAEGKIMSAAVIGAIALLDSVMTVLMYKKNTVDLYRDNI